MPKKLKLFILSEDKKTLMAANKQLSFPLNKKTLRLIQDMKLTVKEAPGVGLAAPQVGQNLMLAIINLEDVGPPFVIINPKILSKSIKKTLMEEGCLSIPGYFVEVKRPKRIEAEAYNEDGKRMVIKGEGLLAKVLQHEIDHLNGVLIKD